MRLGPIGLPELLIILVVVLLIFGPRRLPEMAKGIGQSVREFRKGLRDMKKDMDADDDAPVNAAAPVTAATAATSEATAGQPAAAGDSESKA